MAIVSIPGGFWYPDLPGWEAAVPLLNAEVRIQSGGNTRAAFNFRIPKTGTLDQAEFYLTTVTTAHDLKVSFQDISPTTGFPDGTVDQFRVVATASVTANTWIAPGLITSDGTNSGTKRSVTRGDLISVVFEWDSTQGDIRFGCVNVNSSGNASPVGQCYVSQFNVSWALSGNEGMIIGLKYNDGTYGYIGPVAWPCLRVINTTTFNSGSNPSRRGAYFSLPIKCQCGGFWLLKATGGGDTDVVLYDTDGTTTLASASLDKDIVGTVGAVCIPFATPVTLNASSNYRLTVNPSSVTNISTYDVDCSTAALMDGFAGGQNFQYTSWNGSAWTQTTTKRPFIGLLLDGIDVSTPAGGGMLVHPGMVGGCRG